MVSAIYTSLTGLESATRRLQASAANIANLQTAGSLEPGGQKPYTPVTTQQSAITDGNGNTAGVSTQIVPKSDPYVPVYNPDSPFANSDGIIGLPNTDLAEEGVNLLIAKATYKANIAAIKTENEMSDDLLKMFDQKA